MKAPWQGPAVAAAVILLDQVTKAWVLSTFQLGESLTVTSFFDLVLVFNAGAAFSFLAGAGGWQKWFFLALALAVSGWIVVAWRRHPAERQQNLALALVMGGALGNAIDRLRFDAVADFLFFHAGPYGWPAFNGADSAIFIGVALLLLQQMKSEKS